MQLFRGSRNDASSGYLEDIYNLCVGLTDSVKLGYNPRRIGVMADPERQKSFIFCGREDPFRKEGDESPQVR